MALTLIIPDADFSTNALAQVHFDSIPCTGVSLDQSAISIVNTGNTSTLVATITPEDTTDVVVWSTSDNSVATVVNGVVTATGIGTATITVTCGEFSDSASVTVTEFMNKANLMKMSGAYLSGNNEMSGGGNGLTVIYTSSTYKNRGTLASSTGDKYINEYGSAYFYPYLMPKNTKRIKITDTGSSGIKKQAIFWYNHETTPSVSGYDDYTGVIGQTVVSSESATTLIVNVPTYEGYEIDALAIMFRTYKSGTTFVDTDFSDVTIEFLTAET